jgi:hypothetical protein
MATITASGTWSALDNTGPLSQAPGAVTRETMAQHRDTTEERYLQDSLNYRTQLSANMDGYPEVNQFLGAFAAGYAVAPLVALQRIGAIIKSMLNSEETPESRRVYTP